MFTGGTYAAGEMCMRRSPMPEGFINEDDIIGNTVSTTDTTQEEQNSLHTNRRTILNTTSTTSTDNVEEPKVVEEPKTEEVVEPTITEPSTTEEPNLDLIDGPIVDSVDKESLLSNPDWKTIVDIVRNNDNTFSVVDVFTSTIVYNNTTKKFPWIVADIRTITDSDNVEHNALILISKYACIQKLPFDNGNDNSYKYSIIRQYLNSETTDNWFTLQYDGDVEYSSDIPAFQSTLPEDFVKNIKPVKLDNECIDKFWIPSLDEMNVNYPNSSDVKGLQYFVDLSEDGSKIEIGTTNTNYKFKRANTTSTAVPYWTRTPFDDTAHNSVYACFASNGSINSNIVTDSFAVVPVCAIY